MQTSHLWQKDLAIAGFDKGFFGFYRTLIVFFWFGFYRTFKDFIGFDRFGSFFEGFCLGFL